MTSIRWSARAGLQGGLRFPDHDVLGVCAVARQVGTAVDLVPFLESRTPGPRTPPRRPKRPSPGISGSECRMKSFSTPPAPSNQPGSPPRRGRARGPRRAPALASALPHSPARRARRTCESAPPPSLTERLYVQGPRPPSPASRRARRSFLLMHLATPSWGYTRAVSGSGPSSGNPGISAQGVEFLDKMQVYAHFVAWASVEPWILPARPPRANHARSAGKPGV